MLAAQKWMDSIKRRLSIEKIWRYYFPLSISFDTHVCLSVWLSSSPSISLCPAWNPLEPFEILNTILKSPWARWIMLFQQSINHESTTSWVLNTFYDSFTFILKIWVRMDRMYNFKWGVTHPLTFDILLQLGWEGNFDREGILWIASGEFDLKV